MAPTVTMNLTLEEARKAITSLIGEAKNNPLVLGRSLSGAPIRHRKKIKIKAAKAEVKKPQKPKKGKKVGRPKGSKNKPKKLVAVVKAKVLRPKPARKTKAAKPARDKAKESKTDKTAVVGALIAFLKDGPQPIKAVAKAVGAKGKALGGIVGSHNRWTKTPRIVVATMDGEKQFSLEMPKKAEEKKAPEPAPTVSFADAPTGA